jgi:hypothetical protein
MNVPNPSPDPQQPSEPGPPRFSEEGIPASLDEPAIPPEPPPSAWQFVDDYPVLTVVGAFVVGITLGWSAHHKVERRHSPEGALAAVKDLLHQLGASLQEETESVVDGAGSKAAAVVDSVKSAIKRCCK